jgi:hypothetical protein
MRLPGMARRLVASALGRKCVLHVFPLGCVSEPAEALVPVPDREFDGVFLGTLRNFEVPDQAWKRMVRTMFLSPKERSRLRLVQAVRELQAARPELKLFVKMTSCFHSVPAADRTLFPEALSNAKVSLVPRGSSLETFRFFESMRAGCVLITESLPASEYYDGCPCFRVSDWGEIQELIPSIINDPPRMRSLQEETLRWWQTMCCEEAVARRMARVLTP